MNSIQLTRDLIAIESVNQKQGGRKDAEAQIGAYVKQKMIALGLDVFSQKVTEETANIIGMYQGGEKSDPWLLFCSHMDTVSIENMDINPFDPVIQNERIYGRGSCDTKSSGACMLSALEDVMNSPSIKANIAIIFSVDEEIGKTGIVKFLEEELQQRFKQISGVIVGEPSMMRIISAHCGALRIKIETSGKAAHSSKPDLGVSAISRMTHIIQKLENDYIPSLQNNIHPLIGHAACSINTIHGGQSVNIIPDHCSIEVDRRILPGENLDSVFSEIKNFLSPLNEKCQIQFPDPLLTDPALDNSAKIQFLSLAKNALALEHLNTDEIGVVFGTEASNFSEYDIPALVIGPGSIDQAHQAVEWVDLQQIEYAHLSYKRLMSTYL